MNSKFQLKSSLSVVFSFLLLLTACNEGNGKKISDTLPPQPETGQAGDGQLPQIIDYIRIDSGLPAMAAVMVQNGKIIEMAATGGRSINGSVAVTIEDKWHLGSLTKSMTSTMVAMLVKQELFEWDTTIAEIYPELVGVMQTSYENIRLDQLLSHTSGMRANIPNFNKYHGSSLDLEAQRQKILQDALVLSPEVDSGEYLYSNLGYIVTGAIIEKVTGTSWETLLENSLFNSLAMSSSGFGAPDVQNNLTQPVGHASQGSGWKAITSGNTDNPAALGPAGTVHSSLENVGFYIAAHLAGARGNDVDGLLDSSEFTKLHTSMSDANYALGWSVKDGLLEHSGSNTLWLASIQINVEKNVALFIVTNAADLQNQQNSVAKKAVDRLSVELFKRADVAVVNY
jgi:CubicO group peptidase (beta-lactamase class C family)